MLAGCAAFVGEIGSFRARAASALGRLPNVILMLADDRGYEALSVYGNETFKTPRIDQLAREGVRFERAYATPLCTPTRVELMTGRHGHRNYERFGQFPPKDKDQTFGDLMKNAGYVTCFAGKCQLGRSATPFDMGFDRSMTYEVTQGKTINSTYYWDPVGPDGGFHTDPTTGRRHCRIEVDGKPYERTDARYGPDIVNRFVLDFVSANSDRPFFVYYPMPLIHSPIQHMPDSAAKDEFEWKPLFKDERFVADMVSYMDKLVGQVVDRLDELGIRENMLLLFAGDNGTAHHPTRFRGAEFKGAKGGFADPGIHVPLVAHWKGTLPPGRVCDDLVDFTDFYATLADLTGQAAPDSRDGVSFLPQLKGRKGTPREWAFVYYAETNADRKGEESEGKEPYRGYCAMLADNWKLCHDGRLYNLTDDPDAPVGLRAGPRAQGAQGGSQRDLHFLGRAGRRKAGLGLVWASDVAKRSHGNEGISHLAPKSVSHRSVSDALPSILARESRRVRSGHGHRRGGATGDGGRAEGVRRPAFVLLEGKQWRVSNVSQSRGTQKHRRVSERLRRPETGGPDDEVRRGPRQL